MTAAPYIDAGPKPAPDTTPDSAAAHCRKLWSAVVLAAYNDWWRALDRADGDARCIARIRASALRWAQSSDGRMVLALAGVSVDPEQVADAAVDADAARRTKRLRDAVLQ